ncbi:hypothetical protein FF1_018456 [Malus domestica]|nr:uncharacterized protein LOC103426856 [Malus domestica]
MQDIISSAAIKSVNRFPSLQGGCWVEFGYTDNTAVYHTKAALIFDFKYEILSDSFRSSVSIVIYGLMDILESHWLTPNKCFGTSLVQVSCTFGADFWFCFVQFFSAVLVQFLCAPIFAPLFLLLFQLCHFCFAVKRRTESFQTFLCLSSFLARIPRVPSSAVLFSVFIFLRWLGSKYFSAHSSGIYKDLYLYWIRLGFGWNRSNPAFAGQFCSDDEPVAHSLESDKPETGSTESIRGGGGGEDEEEEPVDEPDDPMEEDAVNSAAVFCIRLKQPRSNLQHKMSVPELCRNFRYEEDL